VSRHRLVICTGVFGVLSARTSLDVLRIEEPDVRGFAPGVASHGIGTARVFQISDETGAFAGLGMGLNGLFTAFVMPVLLPMVLR
jgi:putative effector of murein hydrolase